MEAKVQLIDVELDVYAWCDSEEKFLEAQAPYITIGLTPGNFNPDSSYQTLVTDNKRMSLDKRTFADWSILGIKMTILRSYTVTVDISEALQELASKSITIQAAGGNEYNTKCEVHMPGQALSLYNDMLLLEDACTDALQDNLNKGWRIIAACPQANQRRPDYILGRYNPDRSITTGAAR